MKKLKAIKDIEAAGFGYIKFELEGQLYRSGRHAPCVDCTNGIAACADCNGTGVALDRAQQRFPVDTYTDCRTCEGEGGQTCSRCAGSGSLGSWTEDLCHKFMLNYVLQAKYNMTYDEMRERNPLPTDRRFTNDEKIFFGMPGLTFGRFYRDGSVDSEYTFTVPIGELADVPYYLKAFKALAAAVGGGLETSGAGMHISVLPAQNEGRYPGSYRMPMNRVNNFISEMTKLLPALFFVGTAGHRTRDMRYRTPQISENNKYSAIFTHGNTCFEYRVFETCYDSPEAVFDFVSVIAQSLKFYANPALKVKQLGKQFGFNSTNNVAEYYNTPEQLRILNATVKYLRPETKSFKQLKLERGLKHTIKSLNQGKRIRLADLRRQYDEYVQRWEDAANLPFNAVERRNIQMLMEDENFTVSEAERFIRGNRQQPLTPFSRFLERNINTSRSFVGRVTV